MYCLNCCDQFDVIDLDILQGMFIVSTNEPTLQSIYLHAFLLDFIFSAKQHLWSALFFLFLAAYTSMEDMQESTYIFLNALKMI